MPFMLRIWSKEENTRRRSPLPFEQFRRKMHLNEGTITLLSRAVIVRLRLSFSRTFIVHVQVWVYA